MQIMYKHPDIRTQYVQALYYSHYNIVLLFANENVHWFLFVALLFSGYAMNITNILKPS